jgi:hypothetical protein
LIIFPIVSKWASTYLNPSIYINPKKKPSYMIHRVAKPKPIPEQLEKSHGNIKIPKYPEVSRRDPQSGHVKTHIPKT